MISNIPTIAADQHRQRSNSDMLDAARHGRPLTREQIAQARASTQPMTSGFPAGKELKNYTDPYEAMGGILWGVDLARPSSDRTALLAGGRRHGKSYFYELWKRAREQAIADNK